MQMTNNDENFIAFCNELRAYVEEHHHFPNKHANLPSRVKYTRKKIREGTLEEWKVQQFLEIEGMRDRAAFPFKFLQDKLIAQYKLKTIRQNLLPIMDE